MNNKGTKEQSGLGLPDWKQVKIPADVESLTRIVVDSAFAVHNKIGPVLLDKTPRSNCVMDVSKLLAAGVKVRTVAEALEDSLKNWKSEL